MSIRRPEPIPALDQGLDPRGDFYRRAEELYDAYLEKEYSVNYAERQADWDAHYAMMRMTMAQFFWTFCEKHKIRWNTVAAVVGGGEHDFDDELGEILLSQLKSLILIDFSTHANRSMMESLVGNKRIAKNRVQPVQFDLTQGLSTVYLDLLQEFLSEEGADTEEGLLDVTNRLARMDIVTELDKRSYQRRTEFKDKVQRASISTRKREEILTLLERPQHMQLQFTSNGEAVPVDVFSLNMVLAGTGAAAENVFWEQYQAAVTSTESVREVNENDNDRRRQILSNIYSVISRYNTEVATVVIQMILNANPDARILGITDYTTRYNDLDVGELIRLDVQQVKSDLAHHFGIEMALSKPTTQWEWWDEPEHFHNVMPFTAKKMNVTPAIVTGVSSVTQQAVERERTPSHSKKSRSRR